MIIIFSKAVFITVLNRCLFLWHEFILKFAVVSLRSSQYRIGIICICIRYNWIACLIACEQKKKTKKAIYIYIYNYSYIVSLYLKIIRVTRFKSHQKFQMRHSEMRKHFNWNTVKRKRLTKRSNYQEADLWLTSQRKPFGRQYSTKATEKDNGCERRDASGVHNEVQYRFIVIECLSKLIWFYNFVTMPELNVFR